LKKTVIKKTKKVTDTTQGSRSLLCASRPAFDYRGARSYRSNHHRSCDRTSDETGAAPPNAVQRRGCLPSTSAPWGPSEALWRRSEAAPSPSPFFRETARRGENGGWVLNSHLPTSSLQLL